MDEHARGALWKSAADAHPPPPLSVGTPLENTIPHPNRRPPLPQKIPMGGREGVHLINTPPLALFAAWTLIMLGALYRARLQ